MLDILNKRRTIRKYTDQPVDKDLLDKLLKAAVQASNTGNMQVYSVIVTTDQETKEKLAPAHFNQPMVKLAPVVLTFCADYNRFSNWCKIRNAEPGYTNFQSFVAAFIDAVIFAQTFAVAAESVGLGICYLGTTTYNAGEIIDVLNLPRLVVPVTTLSLGYPADNPPVTDRLPLESVVHYGEYKLFSEEELTILYAEKENSDVYRQFVAENNKETLAQVFTDVRYPKKNNEFFSEKFLAVLKKQGFLK
jgi:nitroreductase